ncbi:MAG TPA: hypothetical protein VGW11_12060 [Solirubrobacteraceae bacterium]|nr:hypothetical protein [Solirubrobacteraceae bacterium]
MSVRFEELLTIRPAGPADRAALERLAGRDSARVPEGDVVIAMVDGELRAAITVPGGTVIADPFRPTAELVELLRLRATQLRRYRQAGLTARMRRVGTIALRARPV